VLVCGVIFGNHPRVIQPAVVSPSAAGQEVVPWWRGAGGGLRAAVMLLTRLPTGRNDSPLAARRWASGWFPVVGVITGGICAAAQWGLGHLLGPALGAAGAIAAGIVVTGALHEDGLGDTADALGGARDRAQIFAILKDSRHGTYGVLALVLSVVLRIGAVAQLAGHAPAALILVAVVSRTAMVALLAALPYVTPAEIARSADVARAVLPQVLLASLWCAGALGALVGLHVVGLTAALAVVAMTALTTALAGWRFAVRAGGITGDFLGAGQQIAEIAGLLALVACLR
jgi:adenosylcobinamide-GDP ribazoletransferase